MKKIYSLLTLITLFLGSLSSPLLSQCANNNTLLTFASVPTVVGASSGAQLGCIYTGEFVRFSGFQAGSTYRISACGSDVGLDTRLSIYPSAGGASVGFNDDFCGLASRIDFTPTTTGSYDVLLDETGPNNTCISNQTQCGEIVITLIGTGAGLGYCTPTYTAGTSGGDFINGVSLGTINNQNTGSTGGAAYTFYSNLSTNLNFSTSYTISIKNNPTFQERVAAWIDYNGDNTFASDERLGQITLSPNQVGTITFTTPATGVAGNTRLRVRQVFTIPSGSFIEPCGSATLGETEDYVIVLPADPQGPQVGDSFSTACGLGNAIPDNACPNSSLSSINVSGLANLGTTKELKSVEIIIAHPMAADLDLFLESPTGVIVLLSSDNGGSGADYGSYSLDDCSQTALFRMNASTAIAGSTAPFIGSFIPEGNLNDFNTNINPNGVWRLRACDDFAGDIGTVQFFKLNFGDVATEVPSCASNFNISNGAANQPTNTTISWSAGSGSPTSYDVYFGTDANPSLVSDNQIGTTFDPGTLTPSETYFYSVVPSNATGDASGCEIRSFTVVSPAAGILMSNGIVSICSGNFYDSGADLSNYSNDESFVLTINPSTAASAVQVDFSTFVLADGDQLTVYDGADVNAPSLGVFTSSNIPSILTATNIEGALTFSFVSDDIVNAAGWESVISCVPLNLVPGCVTNLSPALNSTDVDINANLSWTSGTGNPTSYDVFFGESPNPDLAGSVSVTSFDPGVLSPSTTYYYKISPVNGNGSNPDCSVLSFTTAAAVSTSITIADADQTVCSGVFTDTGDLNGDYQNDEDQTITFTPDVAGNLISVTFNQFSVEDGVDFLTVYNGNSTSAPVLAILTGDLSSPLTFLSDAVNGSLTFQFVSDFSNTNSGWSATINCIPNATVPPCADNLSPTDLSTNQNVNIGFAWESSGGAPTGYDLFIGTEANSLVLVANDLTATEFQPSTAFSPNTTYFWQVVPSNLNGPSEGCSVNSFTTAATQTNDVVITNGQVTVCSGTFTDAGGQAGQYSNDENFVFTLFPATSGSVVQLDFTQFELDQASADGMVIINGSDPFFGNILYATFNTTLPPFIITSSAPDGALTIIFSSDATGIANGWAANISCVEANAAPLCLLDLFPASGSIDQPLNTELTWNANTQGGIPTAYDVYFGTDFQNLDLVSDNQPETSYSPAGLSAGTQYFWQIVPSNSIGEATFCSISNFTTSEPVVIVDVIMSNNTANTCGGNFYDSGGVDGNYSNFEDFTQVICPSSPNSAVQVTFNSFNVELADFPDFPYDALSIYSGIDATGTAFVNPVSGNEYFYGLNQDIGSFTSQSTDGCLTFVFFSDNTVSDAGWDASISCVSVGNPANCATALSPANLATNVATAANLSWSAGAGITTGYDVFFGTDPVALVEVATNITETSFDLPTLDVNTTYYFQIVPYNNAGSASNCEVNTFTTSSSVDIIMEDGISVTTCNANFYDMGGVTGNYNDDVNQTLTITPSTPNSAIQITFNSFNTEATWDGIYVYDGPDITSPLISSGNPINAFGGPLDQPGAFWGTGIPGPFVSSHPSGALTIVFISDGSGVRAGWDADVTCLTSGIPAECAVNLSPTDLSASVLTTSNLSWSAGAGITTTYDVYYGTAANSMTLVSDNQTGTSFTPPAFVPGTTYFWSVVPANAVGSAVGCDTLSFTVANEVSYCPAEHGGTAELICDVNQEFISNVAFGTINNPSSCLTAPAYTDYTSISTIVTQGSLVPVNFSIGNYFTTDRVVVWADWNQDGDFADAGELSGTFLTPGAGTLSGNIVVPANAALGSTRLRARLFYGTPTSFDPCGIPSNGYGETEDYTVTVEALGELPLCSTNLFPADLATNINANQLTLSWLGSSTAATYDVYFGSDPDALVLVSDNQIGTTFNAGVLDLSTTYFWQVLPSNSIGENSTCSVTSFTTSGAIDIIMADGISVTTCAANFYDMGGVAGNYSNNVNQTLTITPSTPNSTLQVTFNSYNSEATWDGLYVYDGPDATSPLISSGNPAGNAFGPLTQPGAFWGTGIPGPFVSTHPTGALTFVFISDGSGVRTGWDADVTCQTTGIPAECATNFSPADLTTGVLTTSNLSWSAGGGITNTYDVYYGTAANSMTLVSDNQTGTSFTPPAFVPGATYFWAVIPANAVGSAVGCDTLSFTVANEVSYCPAEHGGTAELICDLNQEFISNAAFGTINNPSTCLNAPAYTDYTSISTIVTQGTLVPANFSIGNYFTTDRVMVWVDWNQDGDFVDAGELSGTFLTPGAGTLSGDIVVPAGASIGSTRLRARLFYGTPTSFDPCGIPSNGYGETEDYTVIVQALANVPECATNLLPANLATEVSANQVILTWTNGGGAETYDVFFGTDPDALVLVSDNQAGTTFNPGTLDLNSTYYWQVVPTNSIGSNNSCAVTSFTTSGAVDIIMANGITVSTCAANFYDMGGPGGTTTTSFATPAPAGNYSNSVNQTLTITPSTPNSSIQVVFNSFNIENNFDFLRIYDGPNNTFPLIAGSPFTNANSPGTITSSDPSGALTFNFTTDGSGTKLGWDATVSCISSLEVPSCVTYTSGPVNGATDVCVNETEFSWVSGIGTPAASYDVYFDLGGGLQLLSPAQTTTSFDPGVLAPNTTYAYQVVALNANGSAVDCPIITFTTGTCLNYCDATTSICDEFISNVEFGSINNSSDCSDTDNGYADYTNLSTNLFIGSGQPITITNGPPVYTGDQCGIWVDWNQDGDFDDANEAITPIAGSPGTGPYTAVIVPPADALLGPTRMRTRITFTGAVLPCGNTTFGEVEDYTVIVNPALACPFPNNIVLSEITTTSTVVSWDSQPSALQYLLRYKLVSEPTTVPTWTAPQQIDAPLVFSFLQGLLPCEDYVLQIASVCDEGSGFPPPPGGGVSIDTIYSSDILFGTRCIECTPDMTLENETCPASTNGTCLTAQPIACGETICATTLWNGTTRDLDWYSFTVPTTGLYSLNVVTDFIGLLQILNVDDCANPVVISSGNYDASSTFTLASTLTPGNYAVLLAPSFDQPNIACDGFNQYTVTLSGSNAEIAPVDPVCETTAPFNLFAIPSGGTWTGTGITSASNGTFDPSVAGIGSFVITYNSTANGCASSDTVTIEVSGSTNTAPALPTGSDSLCIGSASTVYNVTPVNGVTNYVWVLTPTEAGTITGTSTSASVAWSPTFTGTASIVVAASSSCGLSEFSTSLNVTIAPIASTPAEIIGAATSCSSSETYSVTASAGISVDWTLSPSSAGTLVANENSVTVTWADGFIGSADLSAVNTNFCGSSEAQTLAINVLGSPFADFVGLADSYCTSEQPAILTGIPSGGYFVSDPAGAVTGNVFDPNTLTAGTYSISYTVEVDGCLGTNTQLVDVVSGVAATLNIAPAAVCNNSAEIVLAGTGAPAGGVFGGLGVVNGVFFPSQVTPGPITITYTIQGGAGECPGFASQVIQVNPSPVINLVGLASSYCLNSEAVVLEGFPSLGTFSGPGVAAGIFTPAAAGLGTHVLTYSFDNGTCIGQDQVSVEVTPNISVNFVGVPSTICSNANTITLSSSPSGAVFSGPGVSGNKFDPSQAGVGTHTITATLTQGTCVATSTTVITVVPSPIASFNYSQNGATVTMINSSVNATSWNWAFGDGGTSTLENPSHTYVTNGNFVITLIATGNNVNCNPDTLTVPISLSVGIGSIDGMDMVQLYPNPTNGDVNLSLNSLNAQSFEIRITDATGRLIANEATTNFLGKFNRVYDLSDKAKGVYFFTITSEKGAMNFRIVRN
jgi:subtilisin-like proprotein convertase family protein